MRETNNLQLVGIIPRIFATLLFVVMLTGVVAPATADTATDDIRKIVWQLNADRHVFYHKSDDRWEAVKSGEIVSHTSASFGGK